MKYWIFKGKIVIVIGVSKGIGKVIIEEFFVLGVEVLFLVCLEDLICEVEEDYQQKGYKVFGMVVDIGEEKECIVIVECVVLFWGKLDILVNNVGINVWKFILEVIFEDLQYVMDINVGMAFDFSVWLYLFLLKGEGLSIVNVVFIVGKIGVMWIIGIYVMLKVVMDWMIKYLAVDWGKDGIWVNLVDFWFIVIVWVDWVLKILEKVQCINDVMLLGRVGELEEVVWIIVFLVMFVFFYLMGLNVCIDGGFL